MNPPDHAVPDHCPIAFSRVVGQLQAEIRHLQPGSDMGLIPIYSLLRELTEISAGPPLPLGILEGIQTAQRWIDGILDTTGLFAGEIIERFREWDHWIDQTLDSLREGKDAPPIPKEWFGDGKNIAECARSEPQAIVTGDPSSPEPSLVLNLATDADLLGEFVNESKEHLGNLESGMLVLEERPDDLETLNSIFRAFHTFKGSSGFLNLVPIQELAHELESVLDLARQGELGITPEIINLLLEGGDTLGVFVERIESQLKGLGLQEPIVVPTLGLLNRVRGLLSEHTKTPPSNSLAGNTSDVGLPLPLERAGAAAELPSEGPDEAEGASTEAIDAPRPAGTASPKKPSSLDRISTGSSAVVKVDTQKLDSLIDLVGELIISQSMVVQDKEVLSLSSQHLGRNLAQLRRITMELQRTAMALRMVPIRGTFQKMTRLVRDLGSSQSKELQLLMSGEDTELDRNIVEALGDPLVHMIRNSVDHGLELPELRVKRGKPSMGTIHLRAFHQGGTIVIQVADDGGGLNKKAILAKGIQNGLVGRDQELSDKEIFSLIFAAGFSTAERVTEISGRGVGMDVVRRNIEKLRGKIEIESVEGRGTTFSIILPLTLAIIDGMIVSVAGERFIIPTLAVRESFRPNPAMISTIHECVEMVNVRGKLSPLLRLHQYFDFSPAITDPTKAILVLVESGSKTRCLMVDELIGKQEVVIKSLGEAFARNAALAGGAVLSDGRVGLILDVDSLVQLTPPMAFAG